MLRAVDHMSNTETVTLTKKQKLNIYLFKPLITSIMAYGFLFLLEVGWPRWTTVVGLTIGFFIANFTMGMFFPKLATYKGTKNPTNKQKTGRIVLYIVLIGVLLFIVIRFFMRL